MIKALDDMTVEQKFTRLILDLRELRPFYSSIFEYLNKVEKNDMPTMAVGVDTLYYNYDFVKSLPYSEFIFIVLHEIGHVALKHVVRMGSRIQSLWNIACDYYVNGMLNEEFDFNDNSIKFSGKKGLEINQPQGLLLLPSLDLDLDSVESLYEKLYKSMQEQESYQSQGDGQGDGQGNGQDDSQGNGQDDGYGDITLTIQGSNTKVAPTKMEVDLDNYVSDLIKSSKTQDECNAKVEELLVNSRVRTEMNFPSYEKGLLEKFVDLSFKSKVNWKNVLRQHLRSATQSDSSYTNPDKRFMYRGNIIMPGLIEDDLTKIEGVKVCIDVSGSISDKDLNEFLGQVWTICKNFKVSAELIYWDTCIGNKGNFYDFNDFKKFGIVGGGGTDPACLFEYFDSKECKDKPIVNLIFTDGYILNNFDTPHNKRKYGKKTIWILSKDSDQNFNPSFGKVVYPNWKN